MAGGGFRHVFFVAAAGYARFLVVHRNFLFAVGDEIISEGLFHPTFPDDARSHVHRFALQPAEPAPRPHELRGEDGQTANNGGDARAGNEQQGETDENDGESDDKDNDAFCVDQFHTTAILAEIV